MRSVLGGGRGAGGEGGRGGGGPGGRTVQDRYWAGGGRGVEQSEIGIWGGGGGGGAGGEQFKIGIG